MRLRFIGQYTNGQTSITLCGVTFNGREVVETDEPRLIRHPEFEAVVDIPAQTEAEPVSRPKRRGRKARNAQF